MASGKEDFGSLLELSDERAAAVANYLRDSANVSMRRVLLPAGYGATHPAVSNQGAEGREINQPVDVKVIVNKGIEEGIPYSSAFPGRCP